MTTKDLLQTIEQQRFIINEQAKLIEAYKERCQFHRQAATGAMKEADKLKAELKRAQSPLWWLGLGMLSLFKTNEQSSHLRSVDIKMPSPSTKTPKNDNQQAKNGQK